MGRRCRDGVPVPRGSFRVRAFVVVMAELEARIAAVEGDGWCEGCFLQAISAEKEVVGSLWAAMRGRTKGWKGWGEEGEGRKPRLWGVVRVWVEGLERDAEPETRGGGVWSVEFEWLAWDLRDRRREGRRWERGGEERIRLEEGSVVGVDGRAAEVEGEHWSHEVGIGDKPQSDLRMELEEYSQGGEEGCGENEDGVEISPDSKCEEMKWWKWPAKQTMEEQVRKSYEESVYSDGEALLVGRKEALEILEGRKRMTAKEGLDKRHSMRDRWKRFLGLD